MKQTEISRWKERFLLARIFCCAAPRDPMIFMEEISLNEEYGCWREYCRIGDANLKKNFSPKASGTHWRDSGKMKNKRGLAVEEIEWWREKTDDDLIDDDLITEQPARVARLNSPPEWPA